MDNSIAFFWDNAVDFSDSMSQKKTLPCPRENRHHCLFLGQLSVFFFFGQCNYSFLGIMQHNFVVPVILPFSQKNATLLSLFSGQCSRSIFRPIILAIFSKKVSNNTTACATFLCKIEDFLGKVYS